MFRNLPWVKEIKDSGKGELWVATHNGKLHKDDVLSVAIVKLALPDHKIKVVRTRDEDIINAADIVLDVGGVCDPKKFRFDHHDGAVMEVELSQFIMGRITGGNISLLKFINPDEDIMYLDRCKASTVLQLIGDLIKLEDDQLVTEILKVSLTDQYGPKEFLKGPFDVIDVLATDYTDETFNDIVSITIGIIKAMISKTKELCRQSRVIEYAVCRNFKTRDPILVLDSWGPWQGFTKLHPWILGVIHPVDNGGWMLHLPNRTLSDYMVMSDLDNGLVTITDWMTIWSSKERALEVSKLLLWRYQKTIPEDLNELFRQDRWSRLPIDEI